MFLFLRHFCTHTKLLRGPVCFGGSCEYDFLHRDTEAYCRCTKKWSQITRVKEEFESRLCGPGPTAIPGAHRFWDWNWQGPPCLEWLICWSTNYYKERGREFCSQQVLTTVNAVERLVAPHWCPRDHSIDLAGEVFVFLLFFSQMQEVAVW